MSERIAVIPARGGSKGLPGKNVKSMAGKPMMAWTIEAALASTGFARVIVSTDDQEIAAVGRHYGAETPFLRPAEFGTDSASVVDVVLHAVEWLESQEGFSPSQIMLLQPTSPLRTSEDIRSVLTLFSERQPESVVSVVPMQHPPHWLKSINEQGELVPWFEGNLPDRRQSVGELYMPNGAIYMIAMDVLRKQHTFYPGCTLAYVMPPERSIDVDSAWEFYLAQLILMDQR